MVSQSQKFKIVDLNVLGWVSETSNERVQPVNTFNRGRAYDDYGSRGLDSVLLSGSKDGQMAKMAVPVVVLMILVAIVVPIMHQRRQKMKQDLQKVNITSSIVFMLYLKYS